MKKDTDVPFYSNTQDGTHCFQASLKMVLKYFFPDETYSWEELDTITAKKLGLWTWQMAGLLWLQEKGIQVKNIEIFDYECFMRDGGEYLLAEFGEEMGRAQIAHSDIEQERKIARRFIKEITVEKRIPDLKEITILLRDGFIVCCNVNSRKLNKQEGYSGHFVIVKGLEKDYFTLHDPGLPARENIRVPVDVFDAAWSYPDKGARNIMAFRGQNG